MYDIRMVAWLTMAKFDVFIIFPNLHLIKNIFYYFFLQTYNLYTYFRYNYYRLTIDVICIWGRRSIEDTVGRCHRCHPLIGTHFYAFDRLNTVMVILGITANDKFTLRLQSWALKVGVFVLELPFFGFLWQYSPSLYN